MVLSLITYVHTVVNWLFCGHLSTVDTHFLCLSGIVQVKLATNVIVADTKIFWLLGDKQARGKAYTMVS